MSFQLIQGKKISNEQPDGADFSIIIKALQTTNQGHQDIKKMALEKRREIIERFNGDETFFKSFQEMCLKAGIDQQAVQLETHHFQRKLTSLLNHPLSLRPPLGSCLIYGSRSSMLLRMLSVITALLKGNSVLLLVNEEKNEFYLEIVQKLIQAGVPENALNLIFTQNAESQETLVDHPIIKAIHFTGHNYEGSFLKKKSLPIFSKKIKIHFGGRNPTLFTYDADLSKLEELLYIAFNEDYLAEHRFNRWFVQDKNYDLFVDKLNSILKESSLTQKEIKDKNYVTQLETQNKSLLKEKNWKTMSERNLLINYDFNNCSPWHQQETLGNLLTITRFKNTAEAVKFANTTNYASAATVVTSSESKSKEISHLLNMPHAFCNQTSDMGSLKQILGGFECGFGNHLSDEDFFTYS